MSFALEKNNLRKYHGVMLAFRCMRRRCYHGILIIMTMCKLNLLFLVCILCERRKKMKVSNVSVVAI